MTRFPACEAICRAADPLHWTPEKRELFLAAGREMSAFHREACPEIRFLYQKRGFTPETLRTEEDLSRLPSLGVTAMKHYLLASLPEAEAVLRLTSSGTRGQKTQIGFDGASLDRVQAMLETLWRQEGLISQEPTSYLMMIYDPAAAKDLGIAFSLKNQQRFAPPAETWYAIRKDARGEWEFDASRAEEQLRAFCHAGRPVRISGIPSFIHDLLEHLERSGPVDLPPRSYLLTGGGWKAADDKKVSREFFRDQASRLLGIPGERIRDGYGMAEHSAPYLECRRHRFHVPAYNRVLPRDPVSMRVLPPGEAGMLELVTPFNAMMPTLSVLSTDLGYLDPDPCPCGWRSPTFTLVGRGGLVKHKGCAITASEIVRKHR